MTIGDDNNDINDHDGTMAKALLKYYETKFLDIFTKCLCLINISNNPIAPPG